MENRVRLVREVQHPDGEVVVRYEVEVSGSDNYGLQVIRQQATDAMRVLVACDEQPPLRTTEAAKINKEVV